MNKGYLYINGQFVILDDSKSGIKKIAEFRSDMQEISIKQNVIESLEKKLKENQEESTSLKESIKYFSKKLIPMTFLISGIGIILASLTQPLMYLGLNDFNFIELVMRNFSVAVPTFGIISVIFSGMFASLNKNKKRNVQGIEFQNKYIEQELEEEREKLNQLILNPSTNNLSQSDLVEGQVSVVEDTEALNTQKNHLNIFFNCGYDTRIFKKSNRNGSLPLILQKEGLSDRAIKMINDYLKPKDKVLTR